MWQASLGWRGWLVQPWFFMEQSWMKRVSSDAKGWLDHDLRRRRISVRVVRKQRLDREEREELHRPIVRQDVRR